MTPPTLYLVLTVIVSTQVSYLRSHAIINSAARAVGCSGKIPPNTHVGIRLKEYSANDLLFVAQRHGATFLKCCLL